VPESRLRLALQYLIATMIEAHPVGGKVTLLLGEGPAGTVLRVEGERDFRQRNFHQPEFRETGPGATSAPAKRDRARTRSASISTLRRVKLAIARRVLETAGASLVLGASDAGPTGFVLRIPHRVGHPAK